MGSRFGTQRGNTTVAIWPKALKVGSMRSSAGRMLLFTTFGRWALHCMACALTLLTSGPAVWLVMRRSTALKRCVGDCQFSGTFVRCRQLGLLLTLDVASH